jgi:hypothetical protein
MPDGSSGVEVRSLAGRREIAFQHRGMGGTMLQAASGSVFRRRNELLPVGIVHHNHAVIGRRLAVDVVPPTPNFATTTPQP